MKLLALSLSDPNINPTARISSINKIFSVLLNLALGIGAVIFLFYAIYGGYLWITSGGDAEKIKKAWNNFTFSVLGLILIFASLLITKLIGYIFKLEFPF